ncbi:LPS translocon maturation chaperone LptM [Spongiibacter marinus]
MTAQRRIHLGWATALLCLALAACGQTGPLVLPSEDTAPASPQN